MRLFSSPGPPPVFLVGKSGAVIHNSRETKLQRALQILQRLTVIQMHADGNGSLLRLLHHNRADHLQRNPRLMALRKLDNHRGIQLPGRAQYSLQAFQVRRIKRTNPNLLLLCKFHYFL